MTRSRPTSQQDIADALGISRATVSNALNGTGRLSPELTQRVLDKAAELSFAPSRLGRALRTGRSATIGLVLPDFRMPLFAEFARAFAMAARRRGMVLMVADSMGDPEIQEHNLLDLAARGSDALVVIPMRGSQLDPAKLSKPLVVIDAETNPLNAVASDHRDGGRQIARHLIGLGHREVLVLSAPSDPTGRDASRVNDARVAGLTEVFAAAGVTVHSLTLPNRLEVARAHFTDWHVGAVTAIAATYDALAVGALSALVARGVPVPGQISITGFDNTIWGQITTPRLTTVRQDLDSVAERALAYAANDTVPPGLVPVALELRESTAPFPSPLLNRISP
ncbi:LacI family DNA-binding transcriptional regulator [Pseudorhodobacter sp. MZDSW-24AT]|uniref:LacI family DNA-binding transcriptional regulator n=1 Tax=Pseudorhodobacter sp. MZDSW-24AT TaxID=2052957 RepID=UPI000C1F68FD|nr:LacI family DNA-binding transcriptional regulator [Pseudorhodobacter sp. MZDSW-24AT]PJF09352.1 LacI family transcriptional regulator [Pseudorhodobacter sp. MZDSW-24AT]